MSKAIVIDSVTKVFQTSNNTSVTALENISLTISDGDFVALLGPSGCGKSTLLKLIGDLLSPTSGSIEVNGKSAKAARRDRDYGMVFQQAALLEWRTAARNIELPLKILGMSKEDRAARVNEMLELVRLGDFADHYPWQLSGGMQQRVAIARALALRPKLLLMDEPLGALDEMNREHLQNEFLDIWSKTKTTTVFVTHSIAEAVFLANKIVVMSPRPGRVVTTIENPLAYPRKAEIRQDASFFQVESKVREALHGLIATNAIDV
jgi:NitT/TauT family transport system ATP-binding protein